MLDGAETARSSSKRKRRTLAELRHDILAAAQDVFSEKGYAAASIREIAKRADAASPLIFRHFENKASLFATAVFEPIEQTLDENLSKAEPYWVNLSPSERVHSYAELVISTFRRNKRLFIAYMNAIVFHADEFRHLGDKLAPPSFESRILQLERFTLEHPAGLSFSMRDPHFEVRLILLLFYSVALFDDLFFDASERDLARELRGVVKLVSMGIGADPRGALVAVDSDPLPAKVQHPSAQTIAEAAPSGGQHDQTNSLSGEPFLRSQTGTSAAAPWPQIEVTETAAGVRVLADLPGMDERNIELSVEDGLLTLRGAKTPNAGDQSPAYTERYYGAFERRIPLGAIDQNRVVATFDNGVLTVDLPRPPGAKSPAKRIEIKPPPDR